MTQSTGPNDRMELFFQCNASVSGWNDKEPCEGTAATPLLPPADDVSDQ